MKTVVILSGGMDSSVLLADLIARGYEVVALTINYGQRHRVEIKAAERIAAHYGVQHHIADLSALKPLLAGSSQTDDGVPVPHGHYAEESMKKTVVANRNMLLLSVAGALAISIKADAISYGAHAGDHAIYPDCREEFAHAMGVALDLADWHRVRLDRPFVSMTKADICRLGADLRVPLHLTYSCYEGGEDYHCGKCGTCVERREAFERAGVSDPTVYGE